MKILLIDPPYKALKGVGSECGYSISTVSLASYLRQGGMEVAVVTGNLLADLPVQTSLSFKVKEYAKGQEDYEKILDTDIHPIWEKLAQEIRNYKASAIGITYLTPAKAVVEKIARIIKSIDQNIKTIVGGYHPTFCPDEVMQNPDIDFIIRGEGEIPLLQLSKSLKNGENKLAAIPGLVYRKKNVIHTNPPAPMIHNLDVLPFPARDLVQNCDFTKYKGHYLSTARGCPYECSFCSDKQFWGKKVRRRSVGNIIQEIKHLKKTYDINYLDIVDGTFTYNESYVQEFCNAIIDEKIKIKWRCTARFDNISEALLQLMKRANCLALYFGLESGCDRTLKAVNKRFTIDKVIKSSELVYKSGLVSITSIILGLPQEKKQDIEQTLKLMRKLKTDIFDINCYVPLPGTPFYDLLTAVEKKNIDWRKAAYKSYHNHFTNNISQEDLRHLVDEAFTIAEDTLLAFKKHGGWQGKLKQTTANSDA